MAIIDFDSECWDDPWLQAKSPLGKLLFIYLWTNTHRNISGLYVITKKTMIDETGLTEKQIDLALKELEPKISYDFSKSVCFVLKHVRRQFLRASGKLSPKLRAGIRRVALKLRYHPFFSSFIKEYPEVFDSSELDTLCIPYIYPIDTVCIPLGEGVRVRVGEGVVNGTQNIKGTLVEENASFDKNRKNPTRHPKTVPEFIEEIKKSPAYSHLNINEQIEKIKVWLLKPENKGKQLTSARILNWLNKEPKSLEVLDGKSPTDIVERRLWEIEQRRKNRNGTPDKNS